MKRLLVVAVLLGSVVAAGCSKNPVIAIPPGPAANFFVADDNNGLVSFAQPLGASSTASFTIGPADNSGLAVDSAGNLYVATFNEATIAVYKPPVTAGSTPIFTIGPLATSLGPTVPVPNISGIHFDAAGNLWAAGELGDQLYMLSPPFAGGPVVPQFFNCATFSGPDSIAFDTAGNLIVSEFAGASLLAFRPPFAFGPNNVPAATIPLATNASGIGMTVKDQLMVGLEDGRVAVFNPPFATGNVPAFYITAPPLTGGTATATRNSTSDASGNQYIPYASSTASTGGVGVFAPPFSASSVPLFVFSNGLSFPYSVGFAQ